MNTPLWTAFSSYESKPPLSPSSLSLSMTGVGHFIAEHSTSSLVFISAPNDNEVLDGYTDHSTEQDTFM